MLCQKFRDQLYAATLSRLGLVPCFVCGEHIEAGAATIEHMIPMSIGGAATAADNIALSHKRCNARRNSRPLFRLNNGVPYEAKKAREPATTHQRGAGEDE